VGGVYHTTATRASIVLVEAFLIQDHYLAIGFKSPFALDDEGGAMLRRILFGGLVLVWIAGRHKAPLQVGRLQLLVAVHFFLFLYPQLALLQLVP
jgi:hypothetical protein